MALSDTFLRTVRAQAKAQKFADGGGLYLYVSPSGGKLWRMDYRVDGKRKTASFGAYPAVSLKDARKLRDDAREQLANGVDPMQEKKRVKVEAAKEAADKANTFEVVARLWFEKQRGKWSEGHQKKVLSRLENQLFPYIGGRPLVELEPGDFLAAIQKAEERGAIETAHRLAQYCASITSFARIAGMTRYDAAAGVVKALAPVPPAKHRAAITDPAEIGHLLRAIDAYQGEPATCHALRIMPYIFLRSVELRGARWAEIDFEAALWRVPAERMKMKRPHIVPLAPQVVKLFQSMREYSGNGGLVFPGRVSPKRCLSDMGLLNALRRMGYGKEEMCIHGFRSTASTILNERGYRPDVIEAQLAHKETNAIRDAYNRAEYIEERRAMMAAWADYLDSLRAQAAQSSAGKVKP